MVYGNLGAHGARVQPLVVAGLFLETEHVPSLALLHLVDKIVQVMA